MFVEKFSKDYCLTNCLNSLLKINLFHQISLVLNQIILAWSSCYLSLMRWMSFLMWGLKLQASPLIYQRHLIRCGVMGSSLKLTQNRISVNSLNLLQDFFKIKKTARSPQRTSLYIGKYQCWSTSRFHPWSFVVFYLHKWSHRRPHYQFKTICRWYSFLSVVRDTQTSPNDSRKDLEITNNYSLV